MEAFVGISSSSSGTKQAVCGQLTTALCGVVLCLAWVCSACAEVPPPVDSALHETEVHADHSPVRAVQLAAAAPASELGISEDAESSAAEDASLQDASLQDASSQDAEASPSWVDSSHAYATNRAQALAQWMDDFFGAPVRDAERADTFVRTILVDDWDQRDGHDFKLRLRGQLSLPKISERVDLIFSGEEAEQTLTEDERAQENDIGVRVNFRDSKRFRADATMSLRAGPALLPGVRLRYQQPISENSWARVTQRLQYHSADGYRVLSNLELNRAMGNDRLLRWGARVRYREDKEFWDWNTGITYRTWFSDHEDFPSAISYYVAMSGRNEPQRFETNYRVGAVYRKQFLRKFLFYELEPSYNWRRDEFEDKREGVLGIVLRLEIMLDDDLITGR